MLRSSPIMKIMKSVILSFLENSGFFRRSKVSTRASRTRRWQISSPPVFPYPFEFPSRNKKENAAEIIFVSKESAFLLHFPRVLTHNRKTEREEHRQTQTRAETRSSSNRTNETQQQQQRLFDNTRDGRGDVSGRLSICPFNSTSRQSRKRVTLITSLPAWPLVASSGSSVVHSCTSPRRLHIYVYTTREHRARGKYLRKFPQIFRTQRRCGSIRERNGFPLRVAASVGQIDAVIVTLRRFFTRLSRLQVERDRDSGGPAESRNVIIRKGGDQSSLRPSNEKPKSYLIDRLLLSNRLNAINSWLVYINSIRSNKGEQERSLFLWISFRVNRKLCHFTALVNSLQREVSKDVSGGGARLRVQQSFEFVPLSVSADISSRSPSFVFLPPRTILIPYKWNLTRVKFNLIGQRDFTDFTRIPTTLESCHLIPTIPNGAI